jgi:Cytochrome P450
MRDPQHWAKPHEFYPEHFLNSDGTFKPMEAFIPFGIGKCPYMLPIQRIITQVASRKKDLPGRKFGSSSILLVRRTADPSIRISTTG